MQNKSDAPNVKTMFAVIALSTLSITTSNPKSMIYNDFPITIMDNATVNGMGTTTPFPKVNDVKAKTSYDFATELFGNNMRDFTKEEAAIYNESLKKIYKSTGLNIFDIC